MQLWHRLKTLWRNVSRKQRVEKELDDEIHSYREMLEDEKARTSADPGTARREALLELGGAEQIKEAVRDVRLGVTLEAMAAELRQSWRGLRRNPGLTILGTLMLALGMGASTIVFSIFYSALLRPLPFRDSDRLVQISETRHPRGIEQGFVYRSQLLGCPLDESFVRGSRNVSLRRGQPDGRRSVGTSDAV